SAQVAVKQRVLEDNLWHLAKVRPDTLLRPIEGPAWGYRFRARLSVRYEPKRKTVLVGFREGKSSQVADLETCEVLPPHVARLLKPLRALVASLRLRERVPQIEVAVGSKVTALVLRHLEHLGAADERRLHEFAALHSAFDGGRHPLVWWTQAKGPDTARPLDPNQPGLDYLLPEFGITMPFKPTDFTQVNDGINQVLVGRALRLLQVQPHERVIDWFCGLGNFTLPLATQAREVLGIDGSEALVTRSRENALLNGLSGRTRFVARNLFELTPEDLASYGTFERWLIDPPREGAFALAKAVAGLVENPSL